MATSRHAPPKFETVLYEKKGPICYITLNRPEKLNAATDQLVEDVNDALFEFDADPGSAGRDPLGRRPRLLLRRRRAAAAAPHARGDATARRAGRAPLAGERAGRRRQLEAGDRRRPRLCAGARLLALPVLRPGGGRGGHAVPDPRSAARPRRRSALGRHLVLDGQPLRQRGRADRPDVHRRGGAAARHGQPRRAAGRAAWPRRRRWPREIIENPPLAVRANVRVMRWFVNEMQRQSRLYTQGRGLHLTRGLPRVGGGVRGEAQTRVQGTMTRHGLRVRDLREEGPHRRRHHQSPRADERAPPAGQLRARRDLERLRARSRRLGRHPHRHRRQGLLGGQRPALHRRARPRHGPHGGERLRRPHQPHAVLEADHRRGQRLRAGRRLRDGARPATSSSPPTTRGSACPSPASA